MNSGPDITFQYPPELFALLVDTIPLLNRSKKDVILFFRGAAVPSSVLSALEKRVGQDPSSINKYEIVRHVLEALNRQGESALKYRREVLKRVIEFENFDSCWPADQLKAKGLVASIRDVINQKDSFTRMNLERERERQQRVAAMQETARIAKEKSEEIEAAKRQFYGLFAATLSPQQRGKKLEEAMNGLFAAFGMLVKEAFHIVGEGGEGIIEQVDGVIELKGALYFVEMKWYRDPVGKAEISEHLVRLIGRAEARGIVLSASDFTTPAIATCRDFLQHKVVFLCTLEEIVNVLEHQHDLAAFLVEKSNAAQIDKEPFHKPRVKHP